MANNTKATAATGLTAASAKPPSKSALVLKLLARTKGATIAETAEPTGWQPHSTRAFLSGLRKKGMTIAREPRKTGETAYRIVTASEAAATKPVTVTDSPDGTAQATAQTETPLDRTAAAFGATEAAA